MHVARGNLIFKDSVEVRGAVPDIQGLLCEHKFLEVDVGGDSIYIAYTVNALYICALLIRSQFITEKTTEFFFIMNLN